MKRYSQDRALFTDLYQVTMAQGYFGLGLEDKKATFNLFFRSNPFDGGYAICCGLAPALEYLTKLKFSEGDLAYLEKQGIFTPDFIEYLRRFSFTGSVDAVKEGSLVFPFEPILQVTAPIIEAQLVETALLNIINYSTLIATKTRRIVVSARNNRVVDFGLRRAQGDGAYLGTRAALVGGAVGTSFVKAGQLFNAPIIGTHAHSWVELFESELDSFKGYAKVFPDNCTLLIDTYNVLGSGLDNAITIAQRMRQKGKELKGVRIDSGDLAYLSFEVYKRFVEEGFPDVNIVLSSDLDEYVIESIINQIETGEGKIPKKERELRKKTTQHLFFGVGTKLITGGNQSALGGVYKLVELDGEPRIKLSENPIKSTIPSMKRLFRLQDKNTGAYKGDVIALKRENIPEKGDWLYHPINEMKKYQVDENFKVVEILKPVIIDGKRLDDSNKKTTWKEIQDFSENQLENLNYTHKRLLNPHIYKVSITGALREMKNQLVAKHS